MPGLFVLPVGRNKRVLGTVKVIKHAMMKRQARTGMVAITISSSMTFTSATSRGVSTSIFLYASVLLISYAMISPIRSMFLETEDGLPE